MAQKGRRKARSEFGSIDRLPSGRYRLRYTDGTGRSRSAGTFATETDARAARKRLQAEVTLNGWHSYDEGEESLSSYLSRWLDNRTDLADGTWALYRRLATTWIEGELPRSGRQAPVQLGSMPIGQVRSRDVETWYRAVTDESIRRARARASASATSPRRVAVAIREYARARNIPVATTGRIPQAVRAAWEAEGGMVRLGASGVNPNAGKTEAAQAYRLLHTVYEHAVRQRVVRDSPVSVRRAGSADEHDRRERVPASVDEVATIAQAMPDRYQAAIWVAFELGLRAGEVFALQRKHVNLKARTIRVEQTLARDRTAAWFQSPKTKSSKRTLPISEELASILRTHSARHVDLGPDALMFGTSTGQPLLSSNRSQMFARARRAAGREDLDFHDLRHTSLTEVGKIGVPDKVLQKRGGHSTMKAASVYQHTEAAAQVSVSAAMGELIARAQAAAS